MNEQGIYAKPVRFTKNRSDKKTLTESGREAGQPQPMSRARTISEPPRQHDGAGPQMVRSQRREALIEDTWHFVLFCENLHCGLSHVERAALGKAAHVCGARRAEEDALGDSGARPADVAGGRRAAGRRRDDVLAA